MINFTLHLRWKAVLGSLFMILCFGFASHAQSRTVTGKVIDATTNETIIGATVQVKGTTNGAPTDVNGSFKLNVSDGALLEVKYLGYTTLTIPATFDGPMSIKLSQSNNALNEVLVVGYATQKKVDLTGAVSSVKSSDIINLPVGGAVQALQGKAAGVAITQATGPPAMPLTSLYAGWEPLTTTHRFILLMACLHKMALTRYPLTMWRVSAF